MAKKKRRNQREPDSFTCFWCTKSSQRATKLAQLSEAIAEIVDLSDIESRIDDLESRFG